MNPEPLNLGNNDSFSRVDLRFLETTNQVSPDLLYSMVPIINVSIKKPAENDFRSHDVTM